MPFVDHRDVSTFNLYPGEPAPMKEAPGLMETVGAAFRIDNDVLNVADMFQSKTKYPAQAGFKVMSRLKELDVQNKTNLFNDYADNFIGVESEEEMQNIIQKINKETADRDIVARAGLTGAVASIAAGTLSPTIFLPFIGQARGLRAAAQGAAWGLGAGVAQELPLQANQITRTAEESLFSIAASTVVSGMLGGAVGMLRPKELEDLSLRVQADVDMAYTPGLTTISPLGADGGAARTVQRSAGTFASGVPSFGYELGPVTRLISSDSEVARVRTAQASDAGLRLEGNERWVPSAEGGSIESNVKTYYGGYAEAVEAIDGNYRKYVFEGTEPTIFGNVRAAIAGQMSPEKMSKAEFRAEIARAMRNNDTHNVPEVAAAAAKVREKIFDPLLREAERVGLFSGAKVKGDLTYINRIYKQEVIGANTNEFIEILAKHYETKLLDDFAKQLEKVRVREARDTQLLEDLTRSPGEIEKLRSQFTARLRELEKGERIVQGKTVDQFFEELQVKELAENEGEPFAEWQVNDLRVAAMVAFLRANGVEPFPGRSFGLSDVMTDPWWAVPSAYRDVANSNLTEKELQKLLDKLPPMKDVDNFLTHATNVNNDLPFSLEAILKVFPEEYKGRARELALNPNYDPSGGPDLALVELFEEAYPEITKIRGGTTIPDSFDASRDIVSRFTPNTEEILRHMVSAIEKPTTVERIVPQYLIDMQTKIQDLRALARDARKMGDNERAKQFLADIRDTQKEGGEALQKLMSEQTEVRRRLSNLSRAEVVLEERQLKKLQRIERYDELNVRGLQRVARAGQRLLNKLNNLSDEMLDDEVADLRNAFAHVAKQYDKTTARIAKELDSTEQGNERLLALGARQEAQSERMSAIAAKLEDTENLDRFALRREITDALDEIIQQVNYINNGRAVRQARLVEEAANLAPEQVAKRAAAISAGSKARRLEFLEAVRLRGADNIDFGVGAADFSAYARRVATEVKDKIMGTHIRIPAVDMLTGERGAELARVIDIPSEQIEKFLENDVEKLSRAYLRTMAPDIEIMKKYGTVNGENVFLELADEMNMKLELAKARYADDPKKLENAEKKINAEYAGHRRDFEAVISRLRHTWGLPSDPEAFGYRAARLIMNLNVLRFMGGVVIASIPDVARPIMKHGLTNTFKDGFIPMITQFKDWKLSAKEARLAGGALDPILHTRAFAMNDILDDMQRGSKFEKGVDYLTNRIGVVALFDYWTAAMKQLSASVVNARLLSGVQEAVEGTADKKTIEFLASKGIDKRGAEAIWAQVQGPGGGGKVNGVWWPNTEAWTDPDVQRLYRQALVGEIDNTIITPGVEKPLWMDASMAGRMLGQFKGFAMSSTIKTTMAGLQQRDAAFVVGSLTSLALGALSYYLYAMSVGGKVQQAMEKAGPGKWADEAISRSGLLGILSDAQKVMERIPAVKQYANFSGERTSRRGGDDLVEQLLGPSYDFAKTASKVAAGFDDPTKATLHAARQLSPFQNVVGLRRFFDQIEASANLPERRD